MANITNKIVYKFYFILMIQKKNFLEQKLLQNLKIKMIYVF